MPTNGLFPSVLAWFEAGKFEGDCAVLAVLSTKKGEDGPFSLIGFDSARAHGNMASSYVARLGLMLNFNPHFEVPHGE